MHYAMLICGDENDWDAKDPQEAAADMSKILDWVATWRAAGKLLPGGEELDSSTKAKTIRPGPDGTPVVTDGPYLELKEVIGGIIMLEADDIDEAVAIAAGWPSLSGSASIEVRPCMDR